MRLLITTFIGTAILGLCACKTSTLTYDFVGVDKNKVINTLAENRKRVERTDLSQGLASLSIANRFALCTPDGVGYELLQPKYENGRICGEDNLNIYNIDLLCFDWADIKFVGNPIEKKISLEAKRKDIVQAACNGAFASEY